MLLILQGFANSPPKLGGVAASVSEQTGWFHSRVLQAIATEPPRLASLGTPPNLGGEFAVPYS